MRSGLLQSLPFLVDNHIPSDFLTVSSLTSYHISEASGYRRLRNTVLGTL